MRLLSISSDAYSAILLHLRPIDCVRMEMVNRELRAYCEEFAHKMCASMVPKRERVRHEGAPSWARTLAHMSQDAMYAIASREFVSSDFLGKPILLPLRNGRVLLVRTIAPSDRLVEILRDDLSVEKTKWIHDGGGDQLRVSMGVRLDDAAVAMCTVGDDWALVVMEEGRDDGEPLRRVDTIARPPPAVGERAFRAVCMCALSESVVCVGDGSGALFVCDLRRRRRVARLRHPGLKCVAALPGDGSDVAYRLASGSCNGSVAVWSYRTGNKRWSVVRTTPHDFGVACLAAAGPDALVSGGMEGDVKLTRLPLLGETVLHRAGRPCCHMFGITCLHALRCGTRIVSGDRVGAVRVWDWDRDRGAWLARAKASLPEDGGAALCKPIKAAAELCDARLVTATEGGLRVWM